MGGILPGPGLQCTVAGSLCVSGGTVLAKRLSNSATGRAGTMSKIKPIGLPVAWSHATLASKRLPAVLKIFQQSSVSGAAAKIAPTQALSMSLQLKRRCDCCAKAARRQHQVLVQGKSGPFFVSATPCRSGSRAQIGYLKRHIAQQPRSLAQLTPVQLCDNATSEGSGIARYA